MIDTYPENAGLPANDGGVCPSCADTGIHLCLKCMGWLCVACRYVGHVTCTCPAGRALAEEGGAR